MTVQTTADVKELWAGALESFVRSDQKLFHVAVDPQTRDGVLGSWYVCTKERPQGHWTFVTRSPAFGTRGWDLRADELYIQYEHLRRAYGRRGVQIPALGEDVRPWPGRSVGLRRLATIVGRMDAGLRPRDGDLVIVIAPGLDVSRDAGWATDLETLFAATERSRIRVAVVELAPSPSARIFRKRGAPTCAVLLGPDVIRRELAERLRAQADAPAGSSGFRATGAAGPKVAPPPRPRASGGPAGASILPAVDGEVALALDPVAQDSIRRSSALAAARALEGDMLGAIEPQADVVRVCRERGATAGAASHMLLLGAFAAAAGNGDAARRVYEEARVLADDCGATGTALQALSCAAAVDLVERRYGDAAARYRQVAVGAMAAGATLMALEGLRACGEMHVMAGRAPDAIEAWKEAVAIAASSESDEVRISVAPSIARRLATVCREHGLVAQAEGYEAMAARLERAKESV